MVAPKFWAGGHQWGKRSRKQEFIAGNFWEHGYTKAENNRGSRNTRKRFSEISVGDYFAIKGYGGINQLRVWYVGRVKSKDPDRARLELEPLPDATLYKGLAPTGNWRATLIPCTDPDVIATIFPEHSSPNASAPMPNKPAEVEPLPSPNTIFYGPPGTGKTYRMRELMAGYRPAAPASTKPTKSLTQSELDSLTWTEVIALALHAFRDPVTAPELAEHPYIARRYAQNNVSSPVVRFLWAYLQTHSVLDSKTVHHQGKRPPFLFDKDKEGRWFLPNGLPDDLEALLPKHAPKNVVVTPDNYAFTTFHQSYTYEDFVEGIRPRLGTNLDDENVGALGYHRDDGVLKHAVTSAISLAGYIGTIASFCELTREARQKYFAKNPPRFALFIDEINRGNVSRIFGELITLIEPDKRLGAEHELIVTLPGSRQKFGVPANLDIIATMNSADRSVEALDTALRRRFAFKEFMPRPEEVKFEFGGVRTDELLRAMNHRIHRLLDRDHQIGHAYFLNSPRTLPELQRIFAVHILPLLQEYFFGEWAKIGLVLGARWVRPVKLKQAFAAFDTELAEDYEERAVYELADPYAAKAEDFRAIYG